MYSESARTNAPYIQVCMHHHKTFSYISSLSLIHILHCIMLWLSYSWYKHGLHLRDWSTVYSHEMSLYMWSGDLSCTTLHAHHPVFTPILNWLQEMHCWNSVFLMSSSISKRRGATMWLLILNEPCIQIWSSHDNEIMQDYVYVSFHPTIYICLRGIPSPAFSSLCYLSHLIILIFVAPYQGVDFSHVLGQLAWQNYILKNAKLRPCLVMVKSSTKGKKIHTSAMISMSMWCLQSLIQDW